jgi:pimeloyl-ACP methyl ester carboxylesterase
LLTRASSSRAPARRRLTWRYQIPFLAKLGYRVAAPDMPGYNLSDKAPNWKSYRMSGIADTMHSMLVELQRGAKERAAECIVGHDWGGVIAWEWAQAYARDAKKLIVMNAPLTAVYEVRGGAPCLTLWARPRPPPSLTHTRRTASSARAT